MSFFQRFSSPIIIFRLLIAIGYLALGIFILLNREVLSFLDKAYWIAIIILFIAYGAFRLYRVITDAQND